MRRPWLLPLVPVYWLSLAIKNVLYDRGVLKGDLLRRPVISVGSLSAGGAGKTPVVMELARLAGQCQHTVDVLSRGYGRSSRETLEVDADASEAALLFGDEPVEMIGTARVFVGASRYEAGLLAEQSDATGGHLLDDGFQHRKLARDLDIVLLTVADVNDTLLPAGNLREPPSCLGRADAVIVREEEAAQLQPGVAGLAFAKTWVIRRELQFPRSVRGPFVFCGIARPESFLAMIRGQGIEPRGWQFFADHHFFTGSEIRLLREAGRKAEADSFLCTKKDFVKLSPEYIALLEEWAPVEVASLSVSFLDEEAVRKTITDILKG